MLRRLARIAALFAGLTATGAALAAPIDTPLTLRWKDVNGTVVAEKTLGVDEVEALPQTTIETATPWTHDMRTFVGPSIAVLAKLAPHPVAEATFVALNDYTATLEPADWTERGAILAVRHNGELMPVRDKGPYWVVYPLSSHPELDTQFYHGRMVWQVKAVDFLVE
ncbi:hypothetical protein [Amorphus sp. 3PC139-8]|uniref:hypothetical protein n=1 Tax=Amorphus sp. 3PC139-8 TaxID=2735676 RepID=UPI00345CEC90